MNWDWDKLQQQKKQRGRQEPGDGGMPPEMDEFINKLKDFKFSTGPILILVAILFLGIVLTSFFTIKTGEVGIIQRFGKFVRIADPGPNFKFPLIEKLTKVNLEVLRTEEFDTAIAGGSGRSRYATQEDTGDVTLMLTGDLNVALVPWVIQYKVNDAYKWEFKVNDRTGLLRDMSEACVRLVIGDRNITEVIKREGIALDVKTILQKELDKANLGVRIEDVILNTTNVPSHVQPSFNEVNQSVQEKEKMIYQAREEYNKAIPEAKGQAERTIKASEGYAKERVNKAKGDAARFMAIYNEYSKAKDVTKRRMYLETLKDLFPKLGHKYIIDADQKNVLPLLNLEKQIGETK